MSVATLGWVFRDVGFLPKNASRNSEGKRFWIRGSVVSSPQSLQSANMKPKYSTKAVRVGVLGASGYTGAEIVRLLASHPQFCITLMTADRKAGQSFGSVFPHLITQVSKEKNRKLTSFGGRMSLRIPLSIRCGEFLLDDDLSRDIY